MHIGILKRFESRFISPLHFDQPEREQAGNQNQEEITQREPTSRNFRTFIPAIFPPYKSGKQGGKREKQIHPPRSITDTCCEIFQIPGQHIAT